MVNGKGRDITDKDMIAAASVVDVPARTVKAILEQVCEAVAAPSAFPDIGLSADPIMRLMSRLRAASRIPPRFHAPGNAS